MTLNTTMGSLAQLSSARSRSISPENFTGEKGKGGMATEGAGALAAAELGQGWKISPSVRLESGGTFTLAEIEGPGAIQQMWVTATGNWRFQLEPGQLTRRHAKRLREITEGAERL